MKKKSFAIIGGGFSGCTAALYLLGKGHKISIYEKIITVLFGYFFFTNR